MSCRVYVPFEYYVITGGAAEIVLGSDVDTAILIDWVWSYLSASISVQ